MAPRLSSFCRCTTTASCTCRTAPLRSCSAARSCVRYVCLTCTSLAHAELHLWGLAAWPGTVSGMCGVLHMQNTPLKSCCMIRSYVRCVWYLAHAELHLWGLAVWPGALSGLCTYVVDVWLSHADLHLLMSCNMARSSLRSVSFVCS